MTQATVPQRIPTEDLRREVEASGLSVPELARRLNWRRTDKPGYDNARVRRTLGLKQGDRSHGYGVGLRQGVNVDTARRIRRALVDAEAHRGVVHLWRPAAEAALCGFREDRHPGMRNAHRDLIDCGMCFDRAGLS